MDSMWTTLNQYMKDNPSSLPRSLSLQARAILVQCGLPLDWSVPDKALRFMDACPQWSNPSLLERVKDMVRGRNVSDETMLNDFETFCQSVVELNEAA